jgi:periplasmic glucans biosynthesis protein
MPISSSRRQFLSHGLMASTAWGLLAGFTGTAALADKPPLGTVTDFTPEMVLQLAQARAQEPYRPHWQELPPDLQEGKLGYDAYRDIRFRPQAALWQGENRNFEVQFFHLGWLFKIPVKVYVVEDGQAKRVDYTPQSFDYGKNHFSAPLPADLGFAGFRLHYPLNSPDYADELIVFQGASYFRALAKGLAYGLSARALALDTALPKGEEFPIFEQFWIEKPKDSAPQIIIHALLDSPGVAGAYRFEILPGPETRVVVQATLYPRREIEKFGLAPLTSMYLFGENDRLGFDDFRPEVHDSDGLLMHTGQGEWLWRPLNNPKTLRVSSFADENPKGFGLIQRDRHFENYEDLEAHYERRPSVWITPIGDWGPGAVHLVEIPTNEEVNDNIVAMWWPSTPPKIGQAFSVAYEMRWAGRMEGAANLAQVVQTRLGTPFRKPGYVHFVLDFAGEILDDLALSAAVAKTKAVVLGADGLLAGEGAASAKVELIVTSNKGTVSAPIAQPHGVKGGWRAFFDLLPEGEGPIELRAYLRQGQRALSQTWLYQWTPP